MKVFVSHAGRDRAWAEWAAWQLRAVGHTVELDHWDWAAGDNFLTRINGALASCDRMLAICSESYYCPERWTTEEWTAALVVAKERPGFLLSVSIDKAVPPPLLRTVIAASLYGLSAAGARARLLTAVDGPVRPTAEPPFPGSVAESPGTPVDATEPRLPGHLPVVWGDVPYPNAAFVGRDGMLVRLREGLTGLGTSVVHAIDGTGGVGKTQLAVEYAWRFANDYDAVWWINAERPESVTEQLRAFAVALELVDATSSPAVAIAALRKHCRGNGRWLIVLDNATAAEDVADARLPGPGHTLITSRNPHWSEVAASLRVDVFDRGESVVLLCGELPDIDKSTANAIAAAMGDLPLGLAQAAAFMRESAMSPEEYLHMLDASASAVLAEGKPVSYPATLAATIALAMARLGAEDPAAAKLLELFARMAPEPIPLIWLRGLHEALPDGVPDIVLDPLQLGRVIRRLSRYGLVRVQTGRVTVHRLTQLVIRDLTVDRESVLWNAVTLLLSSVDAGDGVAPVTWPTLAELLPHIVAIDLATIDNPRLGWTVCAAAQFLNARGEPDAAVELLSPLHLAWRASLGADHEQTARAADVLAMVLLRAGQDATSLALSEETFAHRTDVLGPDDPSTLRAAYNVAAALDGMGRYAESYLLDVDTLTRRRRVLGENHVETLDSADHVAVSLRDLGRAQEAYDADVDVLNRRQALLGEDHPDTIRSSLNVARDFRLLAREEDANEIHLDVLGRQRRIFGHDHRTTLSSIHTLAIGLTRQGRYQEAYDLDSEVLDTRRRRLGADHPDTLQSAVYVGVDLNDLGRVDEAHVIQEDVFERRRRVLGPEHPDTLNSAMRVAYHVGGLGRYHEAYDMIAKVLAARRRLLDEEHPDVVRTLANAASHAREAGLFETARDLAAEVLATRRRTHGDEHPDTLLAAARLAHDLRTLDELEQARLLGEEVLSTRRRVLGDDHRDTLRAAQDLAFDLRDLGEHTLARDLDAEVLATRRRVLGVEHPDTMRAAFALTWDLGALGEHERVRQLRTEVLDVRRRTLGEEHPDTLVAASSLAAVLADLHRYEEACELRSEVLRLKRLVLGEQDLDTLTAAKHLGFDLISAGRNEEAFAVLNGALSTLRTTVGATHTVAVQTANWTALALLRLDNSQAAAAVCSTVCDAIPDDADAYNNLGFCLVPHDREAAAVALDRAWELGGQTSLLTLANRTFVQVDSGDLDVARQTASLVPQCDEYPNEAFLWNRSAGAGYLEIVQARPADYLTDLLGPASG